MVGGYIGRLTVVRPSPGSFWSALTYGIQGFTAGWDLFREEYSQDSGTSMRTCQIHEQKADCRTKNCATGHRSTPGDVGKHDEDPSAASHTSAWPD